jgi:Zn-dependent peptidase ImmA (M78 family)
LTDQDIWDRADAFRAKYSAGKIPVPIEEIVEFDLGLHVFPMSGLRSEASIDAFLSTDRKTIVVDRNVHDAPGIAIRYRFSLAHEVGHLELHAQIIPLLEATSIEEWKQVRQAIPEDQYNRIELQAYEFAGRLLVPPDLLRLEVDSYRQKIDGYLNTFPDADVDTILANMSRAIGQKFHVSGEVISRRIIREGIIIP